MPLEHSLALPLPAELEILEILWSRDTLSARELYGVLAARRAVSYRTVKTILALMQGKGLLEKQVLARPALYRAVYSRSELQQLFLTHAAQLLFQGDMNTVFRAVLSHPDLETTQKTFSLTVSKQIN